VFLLIFLFIDETLEDIKKLVVIWISSESELEYFPEEWLEALSPSTADVREFVCLFGGSGLLETFISVEL